MKNQILSSLESYNRGIVTLERSVTTLDLSLRNTDSDFTKIHSNLEKFNNIGIDGKGIFDDFNDAIYKLTSTAERFRFSIDTINEGLKNDNLSTEDVMQSYFSLGQGFSALSGAAPGSDLQSAINSTFSMLAGVGAIMMGDIATGILAILQSIPDFIDAFTKSSEEKMMSWLSNLGFDDPFSEDDPFIKNLGAAYEASGDMVSALADNIEEAFDNINISNEDEFQMMSSGLEEAMKRYIAEGHTYEEAFDKFGDELEELVRIQEQYGFEMNGHLREMLELRASETTEGRTEAITAAVAGYDKMIAGLEKQLEINRDLGLSSQSLGAIAGSFLKQYNQLTRDGYSGSEALNLLQPVMDRYSEILKSQGMETNDIPGWNDLMAHFDRISSVSGYIDMMSGAQEVLEQLSKSRLLDEETFAGQESLAGDVYAQLTGSGLSDEQALAEMAGWLGDLVDASTKSGIELSDEIKEMIRRADEYGIDLEASSKKSLDEIIEEGIDSGFSLAVDTINAKLLGYGTDGKGQSTAGDYGFSSVTGTGISGSYDETGGSNRELAVKLENAGMMEGVDPSVFERIRQNLLTSSTEPPSGSNGLKSGMNTPPATAESSKTIKLDQKLSFVINGREFFRQIKEDVYDEIREDSRRGILRIHSDAVSRY